MEVMYFFEMRNKEKLRGMEHLLQQQHGISGEIHRLQTQINDLEAAYLQRTWYDGNVYVGWNRNVPPSTPAPHHIKINIDAKERLFSLSSITSPAFQQLEDLADRQLAPYGEPRFESKKKNKKNKKRNANQMRRPRSIRKKRRR